MATAAYRELEQTFAKITALDEANAILGWDMQTMMPKKSGSGRGEQMAAISGIVQDILENEALRDKLAAAEADQAQLNPWQAANLREMRRIWTHKNAVPKDLQQAILKAGLQCEMAWRDARPKNDFKSLLPVWNELLQLIRESARIKSGVFGCDAYDALLDEYEPGLRQSDIDPIFADLAQFLPNFMRGVMDAQKRNSLPPVPTGPFAIDAQRDLCLQLMRQAGFDFDAGRLDISAHPFCGGVPDDIRITTRYRDSDFMQSLMGLLHETGHALYEAGLPNDWRYQPVGKARGMAMHESQSLLLEMQACRSAEFIEYLAPLLQKSFPAYKAALSAQNIYGWQTQVQPGLIRIEADEVTYPLHIILRYRLEKAMINGDLKLADLPGAFNDGMQQLLGIRPDSDKNGCMQDVHWPSGAFGYFPTYSLGAMIAAQLFASAESANPGLREDLKRGDFSRLLVWLRQNVHSQASLRSTSELLRTATGKNLDVQIYKTHLQRRYGAHRVG